MKNEQRTMKNEEFYILHLPVVPFLGIPGFGWMEVWA